MRGKSLVPCGIPTPDRPARTLVAIPTALFPLTVVMMVVVVVVVVVGGYLRFVVRGFYSDSEQII
jgi:hypothetical protein